MVDEGSIGDVYLPFAQHAGRGDDHGKRGRLTFVIGSHGDDGAVSVPHVDDLRCLIEQVGIGLRDVEATEGERGLRARGKKQKGHENCTHNVFPGIDPGKCTSDHGGDKAVVPLFCLRAGDHGHRREQRNMRADEKADTAAYACEMPAHYWGPYVLPAGFLTSSESRRNDGGDEEMSRALPIGGGGNALAGGRHWAKAA